MISDTNPDRKGLKALSGYSRIGRTENDSHPDPLRPSAGWADKLQRLPELVQDDYIAIPC